MRLSERQGDDLGCGPEKGTNFRLSRTFRGTGDPGRSGSTPVDPKERRRTGLLGAYEEVLPRIVVRCLVSNLCGLNYMRLNGRSLRSCHLWGGEVLLHLRCRPTRTLSEYRSSCTMTTVVDCRFYPRFFGYVEGNSPRHPRELKLRDSTTDSSG